MNLYIQNIYKEIFIIILLYLNQFYMILSYHYFNVVNIVYMDQSGQWLVLIANKG